MLVLSSSQFDPKPEVNLLGEGAEIPQCGRPSAAPRWWYFRSSNDIAVDTAANEVFVADGYGNRRVAVFDSETGAYKRHSGE